MRQAEFRVDLDGSGQMLDGALHRFLPVGVTLAQAGHEFAVRLRVAAVAVASFARNRREPALKRSGNLASNFVLNFEDVLQLRVVFAGKHDFLSGGVEKLHGDAPLDSQLLHITLQT